MGRPPLKVGAVHDTSDDVSSPDVAVTPVGWPGAAGATVVDAADGAPGPARLLATTVKVYETPAVRPVTMHDADEVLVQVLPPGLAVTTYFVIGRPPPDAGAVHHTTYEVLVFTVANTPVGAPGGVAGTAEPEGDDAKPGPALFSAITVNV